MKTIHSKYILKIAKRFKDINKKDYHIAYCDCCGWKKKIYYSDGDGDFCSDCINIKGNIYLTDGLKMLKQSLEVKDER